MGKRALAKRRADEQQNEEKTPKRKRRPLKRQEQEVEDIQVQQALEQLKELCQEQTTLLSDIKREALVEGEQTQLKKKGDQLQEELNSLLDEGAQSGEVNEKKVLRDRIVVDLEGDAVNYVCDVDGTPDTDNADTLSQADTVFTVDFIDDASSIPTPSGSVCEHDIEQIMTELAEGSLVLVSSLDAEHEERIVNEIYMYDKDTGELCEQPLQIPEHIVQSILNVMS